jgi:diaminohydroxyphosphoribosylaminopyrimidine deaminase/5-amino-6-(5-phosphoribosylamino)uracil reductase
MRRALELASLGLGQVSPNPLVGCVLEKDNHIIAEGYHEKYGEAHAEVNAINQVNDPELLSSCTLIVNLEPCNHQGKTPPCTDLIMKSGIKRVVVANQDPNPQVAGTGIDKLRQQGLEVITGVLEQEGAQLNKRFFCFHQKRRPYLVLKWAQTEDNFIARADYDSKWISNEHSRLLVHRFRAEEQGIMVARGTVHHDNPSLTTRDWPGQNPLRIVLDPAKSLAPDLKVFDDQSPTICYNHLEDQVAGSTQWVKIPKQGYVEGIINDLYERGCQSVLVEGGGMLLKTLIETNLWDEARVFVAPKQFGSGIAAPVISQMPEEDYELMGDRLHIYFNHHGTSH